MRTKTKGDRHTKRMCDLISSARFGRYLIEVPGVGLQIDRTAIEEAEKYDGKWVVTSNDDTLSPEDLALGYNQLMRVEQAWRTLKSGLRLRPVPLAALADCGARVDHGAGAPARADRGDPGGGHVAQRP